MNGADAIAKIERNPVLQIDYQQQQQQQQQQGLKQVTSETQSEPILASASTTTTTTKHLTTFKGNNSNSKSARKKPLISKSKLVADTRNSLESINSKCSTSSANDDSSSSAAHLHHHQQISNQNEAAPAQCSGLASHAHTGRYFSPPQIKQDKWLRDESGQVEPLGAVEDKRKGEQLVAMMSLSDKLSQAKDQEFDKSYKEKASREPPAGHEVQVGVAAVKGPPFMFAGIAASILGSIFFSASIICIKLLPDSDSFQEKAKALFFRGSFMFILCSSTILYRNSTFLVPRKEILVNGLRALFGTLGVFGSYCALNYISVGDSTALIFSSPVWTSILSHLIFKEPLQWFQLLALPASLFGIILIAHPSLIVDVDSVASATLPSVTAATLNSSTNPHHGTINDPGHLMADNEPDFEQRWPGIVISLVVSLFVSCTYIVLKFRKETPIQTTTFWLSLSMSVASLVVMSVIGFGAVPDTIYEWSLLFGIGITSWLGQSCLQWALLYEHAGVLSIVRSLDVALTFTLSAIFLEDDIYWTSVVGATIIGLVVASTMLNNWIQRLACMNKQESKQDNGQQVLNKTISIISKKVSSPSPSKYTISKLA